MEGLDFFIIASLIVGGICAVLINFSKRFNDNESNANGKGRDNDGTGIQDIDSGISDIETGINKQSGIIDKLETSEQRARNAIGNVENLLEDIKRKNGLN